MADEFKKYVFGVSKYETTKHYVYAVAVDSEHPGLDAAIKIGVAKNPKSRLSGNQTGSPVKLYIKNAWQFEDEKAARAFEQACHAEFVELRIMGEWYRVTVEQINVFRSQYFDEMDVQYDIEALLSAIEKQEKKSPIVDASPVKPARPAKYLQSEQARTKVANGEFLDTHEAAAYLSKSASWLNKTRLNGSGPTYLKMGGGVRYSVKDLDEWIAGTKRTAVYDFASRRVA